MALVDMAVSTPPGSTMLTRMPSAASSTAMAFMNRRRPPFEAQYDEL